MKRSGLSLVELLISMAILGILLAALSAFLISNQRVTTSQITAATLENDTRLAFLRMSEVISQAQYIFPKGQPLKISGNDFVTGQGAIAVLIPSGTAYCKAVSQSYCGYAFTVEDRSPFAAMLGPDGGTSGLALIETMVKGLEWKEDIIPAQTSSLYTWNDPSGADRTDFYRSPITDSVDSTKTDLSATVEMASYSDFDKGFRFGQDDDDEADGLLAAVESRIYLRRTINNQTLEINRSNFVFSRAVPRGSLPIK